MTRARPAPANPIDAPGTPEAAWSSWPELGRLPALDATTWASAVIIAAHPDDEVLGPGGIIATLAAAGARMRIVAVTDGEGSHGHRADPVMLSRRRAAERLAALHALGAGDAEIIRLGLPDTGLAGREAEIASALGPLVSGFDACLAPWELDVHADHEAVGRAARQVSHQAAWNAWFYPVWMWHWARPGDPRVPWRRAARVRLDPASLARKHVAISCFTSQLEGRPGGAGPVLPPAFIPHFLRGYELLFPMERP
ncbi:MAG TPA: PIG-L family deacetylase [Streptosporangiaceae bacterium]|jgi:LmbE family N-acetylglucosaminyl deacetylase|nr:PIG-L family deacetylase [Streptosporangiaceae bacterium]